MSHVTTNTQEEWLKILGKGMVTLPKKWRDEMDISEGDIVKAKKEGNRVVIEATQRKKLPYRLYTAAEIKAFLKEDKVSEKLAQSVKRHLVTVEKT